MMQIPFGSLPSMSALFLDYINDWSRVREFYPQDYSLDSVVNFARQRPVLDRAHRERLCTALEAQQRQWGGNPSSVEKFETGAVAVICGQQPGLFTGPNYTILKAITAIKLARALNDRGTTAVPVFWIAAEDHDYQEIEWVALLDRDSAVQQVRVDLSNPESRPSGWLELRGDVVEAISTCLRGLPESEFQPEVRDLLMLSYQPGVSPVDAFARMMTKLFDGSDLILVNPLDAGLRKLATGTLHQVVRQNSEIRSALLARNRALTQAGYHEQVKIDDDFSGLFTYRGKSRLPVRPAELSTDLMLSPNVLVRPAVQDAIFPTAAYVGGPAEIAYFGQAAAVYGVLGRAVPPVVPRISATLLEPRVARAMKKYEMAFTDVFRGRDFMRRQAVARVQSVDIFDRARDHISSELESLRPVLSGADSTLEGALDTSRQKILHQVEALRTKFVNAEARRNETLERHLDTIGNALFPEKKLQERVLNITSFLVRYGVGLLPVLEEVLSLDSRSHQVVEI
jgi:bacillithiol synthase